MMETTQNGFWMEVPHITSLHAEVSVGKRGEFFTASECGKMVLTPKSGNQECGEDLTLDTVYYSEEARPNVISETQLIKRGAKVMAEGTTRVVEFNGRKVISATLNKGLWVVSSHIPIEQGEDLVSHHSRTISDDETRDIHAKLGHLHVDAINKMIDENMVDGLPSKHLSSCLRNKACPHCVAGKATHEPWDKGDKYDEKIESERLDVLDEIHSDSSGKIEPASRYKNHYIFLYIDAASCYCFAFGTRTLDKQNDCYRILTELLETQLKKRPKLFICDGHGCYDNNEMRSFLASKGTRIKIRMPRTPRQNPIAERRMRTLFEMARTIMIYAGAPDNTWEDAIMFCVWIRNRVYTRSLIAMVPFRKIWKKKPDLSYVHPWGCLCYVIIHKLDRNGKWAPNAIPCALMGIAMDYSGFKTHVLETGELMVSRDVTFYDKVFPFRNEPSRDLQLLNPYPLKPSDCSPLSQQIRELTDTEMIKTSSKPPTLVGTKRTEAPLTRQAKRKKLSSSSSTREDGDQSESLSSLTPVQLERGGETSSFASGDGGDEKSCPSTSEPKVPSDQMRRLFSAEATEAEWFYASMYAADANPKMPEVPSNMEEALSGPDADEWETAYKREWQAWDRTGTLRKANKETLEKVRTKKIKVHLTRTILSLKLNAEGTVERHKVRTVVKGYTMEQGVDYFYTHSPTARHATVRLTISWAVQNEWEVLHYDIPNAYLNGKQETLVVIRIPEGWNRIMGNELGKDGDPVIMSMSIYGAPNAGRTWNCALNQFLIKEGYSRVCLEPCFYFKWTKRETTMMISTYTVYVDDLLEGGNDMIERNRMRKALEKKFLAKCLGRVSFILGISCTWDNFGGCKMTQTAFMKRIIEKYGLEKTKRRYTPADRKPTEEMCPQTEEEEKAMEEIPYRQLIGAELYLVVCTRPDLAYIVGALARYNHKPGKVHWEMAKTVLKYIRHTMEMGLYYKFERDPPKDKNGIVISQPDLWTDSSYIDGDEGKTTLGELIYNRHHLIHWRSSLSPCVPQSTAEAEIMAANSGARELEWFTQLVSIVLGQEFNKVPLHIDCQPAMDSIVSAKVPKKLRHMKAKFYYVRDLYIEGAILPTKEEAEDQRADVLTKPRPNPTFSEQRTRLCVE
jgi:hypothetical protein